MSLCNQLRCDLKLLVEGVKISRHSLCDSSQLETDSSKTLCQRVVQFMGEALSLLKDGAKSPLLCANVKHASQKAEENDATHNRDKVSFAPPRRAGNSLQVAH